MKKSVKKTRNQPPNSCLRTDAIHRVLRMTIHRVLRPRAFALIIAVGFGLLMGILSIIMIRQSITTVQLGFNKVQSAKAYFASQAGVEVAMLNLKKINKGDNTAPKGEVDKVISSNPDIKVTWSIDEASGQNTDSKWYIPRPAEGDAGENCKIWNSDQRQPNHSCSWNKIAVGQTVNIPLYYIDPATKEVKNPYDTGLSSLIIKIRTPCKNGSDKQDCNNEDGSTTDDVRYLFTPPSDRIDVDNTIVNWEIAEEDKTNSSKIYILQPYPKTNFDDTRKTEDPLGKNNSEIYESLIDTATNNEVFKQSYYGNDPSTSTQKTIINFLKNKKEDGNDESYTITKPTLKLNVIYTLKENSGTNPKVIPYLEYQIVTDQKISNSRQIIRSTSTLGNFSKTITLEKNQKGAMGGFVIQN